MIFYYYQNGTKIASSASELKQKSRIGEINENTIIEANGQKHFAKEFAELAEIFKSVPPPTQKNVNYSDIEKKAYRKRRLVDVLFAIAEAVYAGLTIVFPFVFGGVFGGVFGEVAGFTAGFCTFIVMGLFAVAYTKIAKKVKKAIAEKTKNKICLSYIRQGFTVVTDVKFVEPKCNLVTSVIGIIVCLSVILGSLFVFSAINQIKERQKRTAQEILENAKYSLEPFLPTLILAKSTLSGTPKFEILTNLPDGMNFYIEFEGRETYASSFSGVVRTDVFTDNGKPFKNGSYELTISSIPKQRDDVYYTIGKYGSNLYGNLVVPCEYVEKDGTHLGNQIYGTIDVTIKN